MKRLVSSMRIAFRALEVNKLRSGLTMLGIIIGVAAVIATIAVGSGATQRIQQQIASIGSNLIIVIPGSTTASGLHMGTGYAVTLSEADARELSAQCPAIAVAAPIVRGGAQVVYENSNWETLILGITPDYLEVRDLSVAQGFAFTQQDVERANKVALLGKTVVTNLFGDIDPVGQAIRIKQVPFTVVGVLTPKGQSVGGQDQDDVILLPISTAKRKVIGINPVNADAVNAIMMQAKSSGQIRSAEEEATALLRQRHHLQAAEADDFSLRSMEEIFAAQEASSRIMSLMLAAVASVSLIVGGIGIMNIMLVSVAPLPFCWPFSSRRWSGSASGTTRQERPPTWIRWRRCDTSRKAAGLHSLRGIAPFPSGFPGVCRTSSGRDRRRVSRFHSRFDLIEPVFHLCARAPANGAADEER
jgi:putative ABC transport system permease protein